MFRLSKSPPRKAIQQLPAPFNQENFCRFKRGIYDDSRVDVYLNACQDFAFLYPQPVVDYKNYKPRVQELGLAACRRHNQGIERRFEKLTSYFSENQRVLEIGAFDGVFLQEAWLWSADLSLASLDPDTEMRQYRDRFDWLTQYECFEEIPPDVCFDVICAFHVLEHIAQPVAFLQSCAKILASGGRIIIEVPALDDPLLQLYKVDAFADFYFQAQHPYIYSANSIKRLLAEHGWHIECVYPHQRYGLANHLTWLMEYRPGGTESLRSLFASVDTSYRHALERTGHTDAVIVVISNATII